MKYISSARNRGHFLRSGFRADLESSKFIFKQSILPLDARLLAFKEFFLHMLWLQPWLNRIAMPPCSLALALALARALARALLHCVVSLYDSSSISSGSGPGCIPGPSCILDPGCIPGPAELCSDCMRPSSGRWLGCPSRDGVVVLDIGQ